MNRISAAIPLLALLAIAWGQSLSADELSVNALLVPRPTCLSVGLAIGLSESWAAGPFGEDCREDDDSGATAKNRSLGIVSLLRFDGPLFSDGWSLVNLLLAEYRDLSSDGGSRGSAAAIVFDTFLGYQWVWQRGFNVWAGGGLVYSAVVDRNRKFASGDRAGARRFIREETRDSLEAAPFAILGFAF